MNRLGRLGYKHESDRGGTKLRQFDERIAGHVALESIVEVLTDMTAAPRDRRSKIHAKGTYALQFEHSHTEALLLQRSLPSKCTRTAMQAIDSNAALLRYHRRRIRRKEENRQRQQAEDKHQGRDDAYLTTATERQRRELALLAPEILW